MTPSRAVKIVLALSCFFRCPVISVSGHGERGTQRLERIREDCSGEGDCHDEEDP